MVFPATPLNWRMEFLIDGAWTDITSRVRGNADVTITRGYSGEQSSLTPSRCAFSVNNRNGDFSPRNPNSPYFGKIGRNTRMRVVVDEFDALLDTFTRTVSDGWGQAESGYFWSVENSPVTDFSVDGARAEHNITNLNGSRYSLLDWEANFDFTVTVSTPSVSTGAPRRGGCVARWQDASNHYTAWLMFQTDATVDIEISATVAGTPTTLDSDTATGITYGGGTLVHVRFQGNGTALKAKCWEDGGAEPAAWNCETTSSALTAAGGIGMRSRSDTGNTNGLPHKIEYDAMHVLNVRFSGEIPSWPPRWDATGTDVWVPMEAAGITRRLDTGAKPLQSALRRGIGAMTDVVAYWPMEEASGASSFANAVAGGQPMRYSGSIDLASFDNPAGLGGSAPLPKLNEGASLAGWVNMSPTATAWSVQCTAWVAYDAAADATLLEWSSTGTVKKWRVRFETARSINLQGLDDDGVLIAAFDLSVAFEHAVDDSSAFGRWVYLSASATQNGANIDYRIAWTFGDGLGSGSASASDAGTIGPVRAVVAHPLLSNLAGTFLGHINVRPVQDLNFTGYLFMGASEEAAGDRVVRLAAENSIPVTMVGDPAETQSVGAQRVGTLLELLTDAAAVDAGYLYEPREVFGIGFRSVKSIYNQSGPALNYTAFHFSGIPEPVEDDRFLANDVTATRRDGSSARVTVDTGPLSTLDPPDGVGTYDTSFTVNAYSDEQLAQLASWRAAIGTWDEARYPFIAVNLARSVFHSAGAFTQLAEDLSALDIGSYFSMTNLPAWIPPDAVGQIVLGYTERISNSGERRGWEFAWNCVPAGPYGVGVYDSATLGKLDTDGTELTAAITSGATSVNVATTDAGFPLWTTVGAEAPFDIRVGGERMTVTAVAAASTPTFVAGTTAHAVNASVTPTLASHQAGDLLLVLAAIRNSGAGLPVAPTGWTRLNVFPADSNVQLFGKIATSGAETNPTVTFTGGVANADTSAMTVRFRGDFHDVANVVTAARACLNASAQNIIYPGIQVPDDNCIILYMGWKQDDWTSVTTLSGASEIGEASTITGDDQGVVWDRVIQTTATGVPSSEFVVTGGAAAISRGAIAVIRQDRQTFTVTRSVNTVVKAHAAGAAVNLWAPARFALS